jgi:3D-(3,5/4)-trihydroxycyclohexane-1,2-dione acylhydrolase (decyclizing)
MRVLTDPAETGAVTLCLPQDVQAEAYDFPEALFEKRVWHVARPQAEPVFVSRAAEVVRNAGKPLIIAGGGVIYSEASAELDRFARETGIPVADTQAGKGAVSWDHPCSVGGVGSTGTPVANRLAREADVIIGVGTRYSDFTTASRTAFQNPDVKFVNVNVAAFDAAKQAAFPVVADARAGLSALLASLDGVRFPTGYRTEVAAWQETVDRAYRMGHGPLPAQAEVIGVVNDAAGERDVVVQAAGSMPGDLQLLWRARDPKQYHVEYGYSCMGFEIAGALGIKLADPSREVFALVGDGSYLMMSQEIVTAIAEGVKLIIVLVQNHGFASIGSLSESLGSQRFGTSYRFRGADEDYDGSHLPVDLAANAESLGATVIRCRTIADLTEALKQARAGDHLTVVHIETDPMSPVPSSESWWDVPVPEISDLPSTRRARETYETAKRDQRQYL